MAKDARCEDVVPHGATGAAACSDSAAPVPDRVGAGRAPVLAAGMPGPWPQGCPAPPGVRTVNLEPCQLLD